MSVFGQGAVNVAGHKISYGLLAAGAGIVGAVLIFMQMRRAGSSIGAGAPSTYSDSQGNVYDQYGNLISPGQPSGSASGADWQSAFSALSSQISALSGGTSAAPSVQAPSSPARIAASAGYANYATQWGNTGVTTVPQIGPPAVQHDGPQVSQPKPTYDTVPLKSGYTGYASPIRSVATITVPATRTVQVRGHAFTVPAGTKTVQIQEVNPPGSTAELNEEATGYVLTSQYGAGL